MAMRKEHRGCNCWNQTGAVVANPFGSGCEHCADPTYGSLCGYKVLFGCTNYTRSGEKYTEPCIILRKDCPEGCTYTSRWSYESGTDRPILKPRYCTQRDLPAGSSGTGERCLDSYPCEYPTCFDVTFTVAFDDGPKTVTRRLSSERVFADVGGTGCGDWQIGELDGEIGGEFVRLSAHIPYFSISCPGQGKYAHDPDEHEIRFEATVLAVGAPPGFEFCADEYAVGLTCEEIADGFTVTATDAKTAACWFQTGPILTSIAFAVVDYDECCGVPQDGPETIDTIDGWSSGCTWISQQCKECFKKWTLEIESATSATIRLTTRTGHSLTYRTNDWNCYDRSTFVMTEYDAEVIGMLNCICVAPLNPPLVGENCSEVFCDSGARIRSFACGPITSNGNVIVAVGDYEFTRDATLPTEVAAIFGGTPDPCSYFWRVFSYDSECPAGDPWEGEIGILIAARSTSGCSDFEEGDNRAMDVTIFCKDADGVFQQAGSYCDSYQCCDPSISRIAFDVECSCEAGIETECCGEGETAPESIDVNDGTNTVTLVYNAGSGFWEGTGDLIGCTGAEYTLQCLSAGAGWYFAVGGTGENCGPTGSCNPFSLTCTVFTGCGGSGPFSLTFTPTP